MCVCVAEDGREGCDQCLCVCDVIVRVPGASLLGHACVCVCVRVEGCRMCLNCTQVFAACLGVKTFAVINIVHCFIFV